MKEKCVKGKFKVYFFFNENDVEFMIRTIFTWNRLMEGIVYHFIISTSLIALEIQRLNINIAIKF